MRPSNAVPKREQRWWISWNSPQSWGDPRLSDRWWISGEGYVTPAYDDPERYSKEEVFFTIVCDMRATDEVAAREKVYSAYRQRPSNIKWRFCQTLAEDFDVSAGGRFT